MDWLLAALEQTSIAQVLRHSRWGYAAVNATHIFGIALLVGAILPLNLRLLGVWRGVPLAPLVRVLVPTAATGLAVAMLTGLLLFSTRALDYVPLGVFALKLALVGIGTASALALHASFGTHIEQASRARLTAHAIISSVCWIGALLCGRLIAFAVD